MIRASVPGCAAIVLLLLSTAPIANAQGRAPLVGTAEWSMPSGYKEVQARALIMQRKLLVAMADSMPERLYTDRITPVQRDFAHQIQHAAGEAHRIAAFVLGMPHPGNLPDSATAVATRQGLTAYINASYDDLDQWLAAQPETARNEVVDFFGNKVARWQTWDEIAAYTVWTAAQTVAIFRKNGMAPPGFRYFNNENVKVRKPEN